jgi:AraC-like DNA-binding protein
VKESKKKAVERFRGLALAADDRRALTAKKSAGRLSARHWRRIRILELLDEKWTMQDTADATGTYPREVRRVARRYLARGLEAALSEEPRPKPDKKFDARGEAAIVALVCSPPPPGRTRWTVRLLAREAERQGIVASVGKETIRRLLESHELKPWREKNVVRARADSGVRRADGGRAEPDGETR